MLSAVNRLTKDADYKTVARQGKPLFGRYVTIKFIPNTLSVSRVGVVVSSKTDKRATARNRLRRQIREIFRLDLSRLKPGFDLMIIGKAAGLKAGYKPLETEIRGLLTKGRLLDVTLN